jgi:hypothetical protein
MQSTLLSHLDPISMADESKQAHGQASRLPSFKDDLKPREMYVALSSEVL